MTVGMLGAILGQAPLRLVVEQIGWAAGAIWHKLDEEGPQSYAKLVKELDLPRDTVMQALGWLAREEKIQVDESGRGRVVSLTYSK